MQGDKKVLAVLNKLLAEELTAINQYMVHSEMCDNWGYEELHKTIEKTAIDEMHHAEWLIARIIYLEGTPIVSKLNAIKIGAAVPDMIGNDQKGEQGAIHGYNDAIKLARSVGDEGTAELLAKILADEERHEDWGQAQRDQIGQMGLENYLANQAED